MATIYRPVYSNRDEVRRALEIKQAAYASDDIDRANLAAAEAVEGLTQRRFYPEDKTVKFDWPNFQYAPPWKLYLDQYELAAAPSKVVSGALLPAPVEFTSGQYILHPVNEGPPYKRLELRRDLAVAFGNNSTPQLDIAITGTFGYWTKMSAAGTVAVQQEVADTTLTVSNGSRVGAGDVIIIGDERMIVTDDSYVNTTKTFAGLTQASAADKQVAVVSGPDFSVGEVLLVDQEWVLVENITGNTLTVRRGWDGSLLDSHTGGTIWARRQYSVLRGQLGTTASQHLAAAAVYVSVVPGLIKQLSIAEAVVWLTQEKGAYGGASQQGGSTEPPAGPGLPDIRKQVFCSPLTRHTRSRAV